MRSSRRGSALPRFMARLNADVGRHGDIVTWQWLVQSGWLNFLGLVLNVAGAVVLAYGAITSRNRAEQVSAAYFGGNKAAAGDRVKMSRNSIIGICLLALGFLLQLPANLPK